MGVCFAVRVESQAVQLIRIDARRRQQLLREIGLQAGEAEYPFFVPLQKPLDGTRAEVAVAVEEEDGVVGGHARKTN